MNTLDNILSGRGDAASEQGQHVEEQVAPVSQEQEVQGEQIEQGEEVVVSEGGRKMVPLEALTESRGKVKRYTEEVADFRKQLSETNAAWERRMAQLVEAVKPKQEPQQPPDQFEDFQGATRHAVKPEIDTLRQAHIANSQIIAGLKWGDDKVAAADEAFGKAVQSGQIDPADYQKVIGSPNIYHAAVQWHQRQLAQAEIGDDPAAFRAKVEAELREKITAELTQGGQQQEQTPARVMPSNLAAGRNVGNRSGSAWSGPASLADIFSRQKPSG